MLIPGIGVLTEKFNVSDGDVSTLILTAPTFYTGVTAFLVVSGAEIWGRRPFYILAFVILALGNFIAFMAQVR
jgi:predicted MFS family arabinose efflux permease